jgi:hypothetical protein
MRHIPVSLATVAVVALALVLTLAAVIDRETAAQDATPAAMAHHPVVGAWQWNLDPADPDDDSYAIFHADGTYIEQAHASVGIGVWHPTGERTADLTISFQDIDIDPTVFRPGTSIIRQMVTVDATGTALRGPFTVEARTLDGALDFAGQFEGAATRLQVEPMVPLGTPESATPGA